MNSCSTTAKLAHKLRMPVPLCQWSARAIMTTPSQCTASKAPILQATRPVSALASAAADGSQLLQGSTLRAPAPLSVIEPFSKELKASLFDSSDVIAATRDKFCAFLTGKVTSEERLFHFLWTYYFYNMNFAGQVCSLASKLQHNSFELFRNEILEFGDAGAKGASVDFEKLLFTNLVTTEVSKEVFMAAIEEMCDDHCGNKSHRRVGYEMLLSLNNVIRNADLAASSSTHLGRHLSTQFVNEIGSTVRRGYRADAQGGGGFAAKEDLYYGIWFHCASEYLGSIEMTAICDHLFFGKREEFGYIFDNEKFESYWIAVHASEPGPQAGDGASNHDTLGVEDEHFLHATNAMAYVLEHSKKSEHKRIYEIGQTAIKDFCKLVGYLVDHNSIVKQ